MHLFYHLVVSLPLMQLVWQGASILVFFWMWSPYPPNLSPISIYISPSDHLPLSEFDRLFIFVTLFFCALHATLLRWHACVHLDATTDRLSFISDEQ